METSRRTTGVSIVSDLRIREKVFPAEDLHMRGRHKGRRRGELYCCRRWEIRCGWNRSDAHTNDTRVLQVKTNCKVLIANLAAIITSPHFLRTGSELVALSGTIGRQLAELLRHYNSRCCQLVLGAGAMQVAGLKTITSTILVLAARSLKLILWFMPFVKAHFQGNTILSTSCL